MRLAPSSFAESLDIVNHAVSQHADVHCLEFAGALTNQEGVDVLREHLFRMQAQLRRSKAIGREAEALQAQVRLSQLLVPEGDVLRWCLAHGHGRQHHRRGC